MKLSPRVAVTALALAGVVAGGCGLTACGASGSGASTSGSGSVPAGGLSTPCPRSTSASGLILVVGVHRNGPAPGVPQVVECPLEQAISQHRPVAVIAVDGRPRVLLPLTVAPVTNANASAHDDDVLSATAAVVGLVHSAKAEANGSDLLSAFALAGDVARSGGLAQPEIVAIDSGVTDTGLVQLTNPAMVSARPSDVAAYVRANGDLPVLSGAAVQLLGVGYTSLPQVPLSIAQRQEVTAIWTAVLSAAGAKVTASPVPRTGAGPETTFTTRTVFFPEPKPFSPMVGRTYVFDDSSALGFQFDSTRFRDPGAAATVLTPLATWLAAAPGRHVMLAGTTDSTGTADYNKNLSLRRAQVAAGLLRTEGAPANTISISGLGYIAEPPDTGAVGVVLPAAAAQNRSVRVTVTSGG